MNSSRLLLTFWMVMALLQTPVAKAQSLPTPQGPKPVVTLANNQVTLEWSLPAVSLALTPQGEVEVRMNGFENEKTPGAAELPYTSVLVALPPQANPTLDIDSIQSSTTEEKRPLAQAPASSLNLRPDRAQALAPETSALVMEEIGVVRGVRLARITLRPVQAANGQIQTIAHIQATLHFNGSAASSSLPQSADPLLQLLQTQVVNPSQVQTSAEFSAGTPAAVTSATSSVPTAIIEVNQSGIYEVNYEALKTAGFPVDTVNPANLKLVHAGQEVAYEWNATPGAKLQSANALRFYAQPRFSRWSTNDTYLLSETSLPGKLMTSRPAAASGGNNGKAWAEQVFEKNLLYTPDCIDCNLAIGRDGDRWVWSYLVRLGNPTSNPTASYDFTLENVDTSVAAQLTIWLIGGTDLGINPDHNVSLSINGKPLGNQTWQGKTAIERLVAVPAGFLQSGSNTLTLEMPGGLSPYVTIDSVWFDAFKVRYQLGSAPMTNQASFNGDAAADTYHISINSATGLAAYNVTDPINPVHLSGLSGTVLSISDSGAIIPPAFFITNSAGVLSPSAIRLQKSLVSAPFLAVDYLMIVPSGYEIAVAPLLALRANQKLAVASENLQAIYDNFNDGRLDPAAIHAYLTSAYAQWHPKYVVLIGDGSVDPKHYLANSNNTILPPYLLDVDPYTTDSASDNRFVTIDGLDNLPDMIIGRLPANTPDEAAAMVNKIVQYETQPAPGLWHEMTTFISDNKDAGGDFPRMSQNSAALIPRSIAPRQLLFGVNITDPAKMHNAVINTWNSGSALMVFSGHSSVHQWAVENFFHISDVPALNNGMKLPVVLEMTCLTGTFDMKGLSSLDEELIRLPTGGAIAVWGSTSEGISTGHEFLASGFIKSITDTHLGQLGLSAFAGQINLTTNDPANNFRYLIDSYILFGDPATQVALNFISTYSTMLPTITK